MTDLVSHLLFRERQQYSPRLFDDFDNATLAHQSLQTAAFEYALYQTSNKSTAGDPSRILNSHGDAVAAGATRLNARALC